METFNNNIESIKKISLRSAILFLTLGAGTAIMTVLVGDFSGWGIEIKMILSTFIISGASVCFLCCSAYAVAKDKTVPALIGIVVSAFSTFALITGMWLEVDSEEYWKLSIIMTIISISIAHAQVLLAVKLPKKFKWLEISTVVSIFTLATLLNFLVISGFDAMDELIRPTIALSILIALQTMVIPIIGRLNKNTIETESGEIKILDQLQLMLREDGLYQDKKGKLYKVEAVEGETNSLESNDDDKPVQKKQHVAHLHKLTSNGLR